jgi:hypothetical protein
MRKRKQPQKARRPKQAKLEQNSSLTLEQAKAHLQGDEAGVYYDGGWDDTRRGTYTVDSFDGAVISHATFRCLREDGTLGGNRLITYKARRWHPVLKPGEKDESHLGDHFYRDKPYKTTEELDREDASADVYGTLTPEPRRPTRPTDKQGDEVHWINCSDNIDIDQLPKGKVLCTNNMLACTPSKTMTHVWVATLALRKQTGVIGLDPIQMDGFGINFAGSTGPVWNITHWAPLPQPWNSKWELKLVRDQVATIVK